MRKQEYRNKNEVDIKNAGGGGCGGGGGGVCGGGT